MNEETTTLPISSTKKRTLSFVIDDLVIMVLMIAIFYDQLMLIASHVPTVLTPEALEAFQEEMKHFSTDNLLMVLSLKALYHTFFVWQNGMTLGKYLMKIRVVEIGTSMKPTFVKAFLRAILRIGSEAIFYLGFLLAFFLPLKQTFHDKFSDCVVIDV
jgi:uncharacterized RDD family membrane protein YckC